MKNILNFITAFYIIATSIPTSNPQSFFSTEKVRREAQQSIVHLKVWKDVTLIEKETKMIKNNIIESGGTGTIINHSKNKTFILTAAHVCSLIDDRQKKRVFPEYDSNKYNIEIESLIAIIDIDGKPYPGLVFVMSNDFDICIAVSKKINKPSLSISNKPPRIAERVYSLGYPDNTWDAGVVPIFEGFYSGERDMIWKKEAIYTIPIYYGSSGSPIITAGGKILGVIHHKSANFQSYSIASTLKQTESLLIFAKTVLSENGVEEQLESIDQIDIEKLLKTEKDMLLLKKPPEPDIKK